MVAIEPDTGKILAMVSLPSYDPNKLASHDLGSVDDVYDRLLADPAEPLINRATSKRLPPGSTFKLVTAAAAIENGLYESDDDVPAGAIYDVPQTSSDIGNEGPYIARVPAGMPHTFINAGKAPFRLVAVFSGDKSPSYSKVNDNPLVSACAQPRSGAQ